VPICVEIIFYVIAFVSAGASAMWIVPTGVAGMGLLILAEVHVTQRQRRSRDLAG
jgi:hypothetical protein